MDDFLKGLGEQFKSLAEKVFAFALFDIILWVFEFAGFLIGHIWVLFLWVLDILVLFFITITLIPAMWIMAHLYPIWEGWIKDIKDIWEHYDRLVLIIPFTGVILYGMLVYHLLYKVFEDKVKARFGLSPF